ncbi:MAG: AraC family transcriptional regulator [Pseudohongiella sp.]|nr:AraC family transcriptional regulator [Pseudohongiella sp.]
MPIILQYLYAIGTFQGLLLSGLLLFTPNVSYASRILACWCVFLAAGLFSMLATQSGEIAPYNLWIVWTGFLPVSYGALLYLYCRHSVLDDRFRAKDLLHLLPIGICYLLNFDLLLAPDLLEQMYLQGIEPESARFALGMFILYAQAFIYAGYTAHFIYRYQQLAQNNFANFNPDIFDWLWIVQGFNFVIWSTKAVAAVVTDNFVLMVVGDFLIVVLIYTIGMAQWRNPQLFKIAGPVKADLPEPGSDSDSKGAGALDEDTRSSLLETVVQYMKSQQAFLQSELSLQRLSEAVGISTHHLSEVLNQEEGRNFYNFVNGFRIDYVCDRLKVDDDIKLLDLGLEAGFSSKSTFNSVFKKHTGMTPSQFRDRDMH